MLSSLKKTVLASLGAIAFTQEKLKKVIDDLVTRGELTREQGKKLLHTLIERGSEESEEISARILSETQSLRDLFPVSRGEFQKLVDRVQRLESLHFGTEKEDESAAAPAAAATAAEEPPAMPVEFPGEALPPRDPES